MVEVRRSAGEALPGRLDGRGDPTAGFEDLQIGRTLQSQREFMTAIPGENEMSMRVDESRDHRATLAVEGRQFAIALRQICFGAAPRHLAVTDGQRGFVDHS